MVSLPRHGRVIAVIGEPRGRRGLSSCTVLLVGAWGWFNRGPGRWVR